MFARGGVLVLSLVPLMPGYRVIPVIDLHPLVIEEYFDLLAHVLVRDTVVVFVFTQADMGVFHHGTYFDLHQLIGALGKLEQTAPLKGLKLLPAAFFSSECILIVVGYQWGKCLIEAFQG